ATGAEGCELTLEVLPEGPTARYRHGAPCAGHTLRIKLEPSSRLRAEVELCGAGRGPAASPAAVAALQPLLEGALTALVDRCNSANQLEVVAQVLGAGEEATLVVDDGGEIVYANERGDDILALHTRQPLAHLAGDGRPAPLLHLVASEIDAMRAAGERSRRHSLSLGDGGRWALEVVALSGQEGRSYTLVLLVPTQLPCAEELRRRFQAQRLSPREGEALALLLQGKKAAEIASRLGITEYTVKDHLKHAYAKLGINSRSQLLARLAAG
ncbi:MAG: helix-turn-helix transcriptional regulator, partial [Acidobacteriota bacterium]